MVDIFKIQSIGEKIFHLLDDEELLDCRLVCQTWTSVLEEPVFWLEKLKFIGHSESAHNQWLDLIQESTKLGKPKKILTLSIMLKYYTVPIRSSGNYVFRNVFLNFPPIYTAAKHGQLEVVKLIHQLDKNCNRPISYEPSSNHVYTPVTLAMRFHQNEIVKYLLENIEVIEYFLNIPAFHNSINTFIS